VTKGRRLRKMQIGLMARRFVLPECFRRREEIAQLAASVFACLAKYHLVHTLKMNEMGGACGTDGGEEK